ncbi:GM12064 [Drosophila sechellia]|uniref:GM12064 n=1 Tax=Drosophila sechellia TaxID=7238 RepID=B4IJB0_DROSE|nr:GM12064 [Drosophila sechellia]
MAGGLWVAVGKWCSFASGVDTVWVTVSQWHNALIRAIALSMSWSWTRFPFCPSPGATPSAVGVPLSKRPMAAYLSQTMDHVAVD